MGVTRGIHNVDWTDIKNNISRIPLVLRNKTYYGNTDEDPEQQELKSEFKAMFAAVSQLEASIVKFNGCFVKMLECSVGIGLSVQTILGPKAGGQNHADTSRVMDPKVLNLLKNESTVNKKTDVYTELLSSLVVEVKEVTSVSAARIIAPLKALLKEFEAVSKFIKRQNDALIECRLYDESYQKLLARNEDTIKSKQKEMDLRVRMEDCRKTLDNYNYSLRNELPLFMRIVQRFMTHIFTMIYYANAYLFYQLKETMQTINNVFKFSANSLEFAEIVRTFHNSHDNIAASTKDISICHFHQLLLDKITMDVERIYADSERLTPKETCIAMYDFEGVQINDLKFNAGDEIEITEKTGKGWWNGRNLTTGQAGSFPVNYTDANK